jgi:hypothetical protein
MVDDKIYDNYKKELEEYFDKVILINLIEMKLNPEYKVINKYSKWMKYSINKWQILNQDEYDKIKAHSVLSFTFIGRFSVNEYKILNNFKEKLDKYSIKTD